MHNLILAYNNFSEVNVSRQFLSNAIENYLKSLTIISNSIPRFTNNVFVDLTSLTSLTISGEIILSVQSLENAIYGLNTTLRAMKLEENYWHYLPYDIFSSPRLNNITNISLVKNAISNLSLTPFAGLHNLQIIDLSMNILIEFSVTSIVSIESLQRMTSFDFQNSLACRIHTIATFQNLKFWIYQEMLYRICFHQCLNVCHP